MVHDYHKENFKNCVKIWGVESEYVRKPEIEYYWQDIQFIP